MQLKLPLCSPPPQDLKQNSSYQYGYSYILGWVGMGVSAIGAILFLAAAWSVTAAEDEDDNALDNKRNTKKPSHRNRAYDYMDKGYPVEYPPDMYNGGSRVGVPQAAYPVPEQYADYGGYRY